MEKRKLGATDLELSVIGFGSWAVGGGGWAFSWGSQDDRDSIDAIHRALDLGINWIDTAAVYGLGHSEEVVGQAIKGRRDRVIVATKCGLTWNRKGKIKGFVSADSIRNEVEDSLRRLRIETIDLYQIHWPTKPKNDLEAWETMADLIREGKVRYAGVSNFSVPQLEAIRSMHTPASLQPPYSMLERGVENEILDYCAAHGIGIVAYSPMQCGMLTGKMTRERIAALPADDFRRKDKHFRGSLLAKNLEKVRRLKVIADKAGRTLAQLAVAWVLRREEVTSAIVGARKIDQIEETASASTWILSQQEIDAVEAALNPTY